MVDRTGTGSAIAAIATSLIRAYQRTAPRSLRAACRFTPSCSEYAIRSIRKYGALRGSSHAMQRILRCHPPNGGMDEP